MKLLFIILAILAVTLTLGALPVYADTHKPSICEENENYFGNFESGLLSGSICSFINGHKGNEGGSLIAFIQLVVNLVTGIIVALGLISIVIGGYFYMTAGGNSSQIGTAKTWVQSALLGIILALLSWVILNTISSQFTAPDVPLPSKPPTQSN